MPDEKATNTAKGSDFRSRRWYVIDPPAACMTSAERFRALIATAPRVDENLAPELRRLRAAVEPPISDRPD